MDNKKPLSDKLGQLTAHVFVVCLTACVCAIMIAGAVRFITWLF